MDWTPRLEASRGPAYLELAEAIAEDVRQGRLAPGTRLPTQRALAGRLGITPGTVARGYLEAERRGLIEGQVGRGTFVRELHRDRPETLRADRDAEGFDLALNHPPTGPESGVPAAFAEGLARIAADSGSAELLELQPARGSVRHRERIAEWLRERLPDLEADELVVCSGGQHALAVALATLCRPGDTLLCERYTYAGLIQLAGDLGLELVGVEQDEYGLRPDALAEALRRTRARTVYCVPTLQNPTTTVMPAGRRRQIAALLDEHDATLVEDDVYGVLHGPHPAPITALAPHRCWYVGNAGKSLAPGLRVGFLRVPPDRVDECELRIRDNCWAVAPLMVELIARWIEDGTAREIVDRRRAEAAARQALARAHLADLSYAAQPHGFHLWLSLPEPWTAQSFQRRAAEAGIRLAPTGAFVVPGVEEPRHVRLSLGREPTVERLSTALGRLAELVAEA